MSIAPAPVGVNSLRPASSVLTRLAGRFRGQVSLYLACAMVLVPWTAYLATSLPQMYVTANWNVTWVGFDILLAALLGTTGVLTYRRHALRAPGAFATAAILFVDAWFDITTSTGTDLALALASAALVELPLAVLLVRGATRVNNTGDTPRQLAGAAEVARQQ